jgi:hypothetical protein
MRTNISISISINRCWHRNPTPSNPGTGYYAVHSSRRTVLVFGRKLAPSPPPPPHPLLLLLLLYLPIACSKPAYVGDSIACLLGRPLSYRFRQYILPQH